MPYNFQTTTTIILSISAVQAESGVLNACLYSRSALILNFSYKGHNIFLSGSRNSHFRRSLRAAFIQISLIVLFDILSLNEFDMMFQNVLIGKDHSATAIVEL